jgi:hypothetical protein
MCLSISPEGEGGFGVLLKSGLRLSPWRACAVRSSLARKGRRRDDGTPPEPFGNKALSGAFIRGNFGSAAFSRSPMDPSRRRETPGARSCAQE